MRAATTPLMSVSSASAYSPPRLMFHRARAAMMSPAIAPAMALLTGPKLKLFICLLVVDDVFNLGQLGCIRTFCRLRLMREPRFGVERSLHPVLLVLVHGGHHL